ncbi:MAG: hypothetical protein ACYTAF_12555, partial [Planctomycetota bacterium]
MIRINLLPFDKRQPERTPMPRLVLIMITVAAACIILAYLGLVYIRIMGVKDERATKEADIKKLQPNVQEHKQLTGNLSRIKSKLKTIDMVAIRKVELWRCVDAVWHIIDENPRIWLDEIHLHDEKGTQSVLRQYYPQQRKGLPL